MPGVEKDAVEWITTDPSRRLPWEINKVLSALQLIDVSLAFLTFCDDVLDVDSSQVALDETRRFSAPKYRHIKRHDERICDERSISYWPLTTEPINAHTHAHTHAHAQTRNSEKLKKTFPKFSTFFFHLFVIHLSISWPFNSWNRYLSSFYGREPLCFWVSISLLTFPNPVWAFEPSSTNNGLPRTPSNCNANLWNRSWKKMACQCWQMIPF